MCIKTRRSPTDAAACAVALVAVMTYCGSVLAEQDSGSLRRVQAGFADLEKAFWVCDYIGTTQGVSAAPVAACSAVTDALKNERFGGDFDQMLEWWRRNKHTEHAELARIAR